VIHARRTLVAALLACLLPSCGSDPAGPPAQGPAQMFDQTVLHRVELTRAARDWDTLPANFQSNTY
jgi:hypothetical protein